MASVRDSKESVFVLTTREYILNQARLQYEKLAREKFDHQTCIIDLSKYSRRIRAQILYNHLHFSKLPRAHLEALVAKRGYVQIVDHENYNPRLIEYLTDSAWIGNIPPTDYLELFVRKLENPVEIWEHAFRNQLSDRARNLLFVLTTMPAEVRIADLERAFTSFHNSQCAKFVIPHSATDFKNALKELDGTFVSTRKVQEAVLARFQNPSIRDFMQYLLLGGEALADIVGSLAFFEQAQWLAEKQNEEKPQFQPDELRRHKGAVMAALQRLFGVASCSISVEGFQQWARLSVLKTNLTARLVVTATLLLKQQCQDHEDWIAARISKIAVNLESGRVMPSSVVGSIEALEHLGLLDSVPGKQFVSALKVQAMNDPHDLDDFETIADLVRALPNSFIDTELKAIREAYAEFADHYADKCDLSNPDELRDEASRIGDVGDLLQVDTDYAQDTLKDSAVEIEKDQESGWDEDDRDYGGRSDECSDRELDSMFGTLGS
jgi:hypothetical protein